MIYCTSQSAPRTHLSYGFVHSPAGRVNNMYIHQRYYQPGRRGYGNPLVGGCLGPVFLVVGLIFALVGLFLGLDALRFLPGTVSTSGTIVHCNEVTDSEGSTSCQPTVRFQTQTGQTITFISSFGSDYKQGDAVTVAYHSVNPHDARISDFGSTWALPIVFGGLGLLGLVSGLFFLARLILPRFASRRW